MSRLASSASRKPSKRTSPAGLDFSIGLPAQVPNSRLAVIEDWGPLAYLRAGLTAPRDLVWAGLDPRSPLRRSDRNPGSNVVIDRERVYPRDVEVPAGGGVGTARAIAKAYGEFGNVRLREPARVRDARLG
jgi:hypothetical protein